MIPLYDSDNAYTAMMLRVIADHRARTSAPAAAHVLPAPEVEPIRHEARARSLVARAFARRSTAHPSPAI
jgi:hypothetical protein